MSANGHFEWDKQKSTTNVRKHGVSFIEAMTVFYDPVHSVDEDRFILLGMSQGLKLLVVSHCHRYNGDIIRIISARKAVSMERKMYERR